MAKKLVLSTKKSLYKPIEVTVDGVVYQSKKLSKEFLDGFFKFEGMALKGDKDAAYKQAHYAFGIPMKVLAQLDAAEIRDINEMVLEGMISPDRLSDSSASPLKSPGDQKSS